MNSQQITLSSAELKIQAKKLLQALHVNNVLAATMKKSLEQFALRSVDDLQLKHSLTIVSQQLGFIHWHHANAVLSGDNKTIEPLDMGTFFYPSNCHGLTNEWFSDYKLAQTTLKNAKGRQWLLPYKKQFIVVGQSYIDEFNISPTLALLWNTVNHDMVSSYPSTAWDELVCAIIRNRPRLLN